MPAEKTPLIHRVRRWPRRVVVTIAVIAVTLLAARIALPYLVKKQVNDRLQSIPGFTGQVADIGIALWRGAYALEGVEIHRVSGEVRTPFVRASNPTIEGTVDPDNVLPTGDSADGTSVASGETETKPKVATEDVKQVEPEAVGAPTGRPSRKPKD